MDDDTSRVNRVKYILHIGPQNREIIAGTKCSEILMGRSRKTSSFYFLCGSNIQSTDTNT